MLWPPPRRCCASAAAAAAAPLAAVVAALSALRRHAGRPRSVAAGTLALLVTVSWPARPQLQAAAPRLGAANVRTPAVPPGGSGAVRPPRVTLLRKSASLTASEWASLPVADVRWGPQGPVSIHLAAPAACNFNRPREEIVRKTLARIAMTLSKKKPEQGVVVIPPEVALLDASLAPLDGGLTLCAAFMLGQAAALLVGAQRYRIRVNRQEVTAVECPMPPIAGMPLLPRAEGRNCDAHRMRWEWRRAEDETVVSRERRFSPSNADVGHRLSVTVRPPRAGTPEECALLGVDDEVAAACWHSPVPVSPPPPDVACSEQRVAALQQRRAAWLQERTGVTDGDIFRAVSYNVLADTYRHCWGEMFPYCDPEFTRPEVRLQLARKEVATYQADIVCLQEVDARWYKSYWEPQFAADGYMCKHTCKVANSEEGCAVFVRASAFELVAFRELPLCSRPLPGARERGLVVEAALADLLEASPELADVWSRLGTVAQLVVLRSRKTPSRSLLVCNTHLYFAGMAKHVKVLQIALILELANAMAADLGSRPAILLCGDLNSEPNTAAMRFLLEGRLSAGDEDWVTSSNFKWGFASSNQAANRMAVGLRQAKPSDTVLQLGGVAQGQEGLREKVERLKRMRMCWAALWAAADEPAAASASSSSGVASSSSSSSSPASSGAAPTLLQALTAELERGRTFKTSSVVALAQLVLDARLPCSLSGPLPLDQASVQRIGDAIRALKEDVDAELQVAVREQAQLAEELLFDSTGESSVGSSGMEAALRGIGLELRHPFQFASAYAEVPEFTNFIGSYVATLDWVLFDQRSLARVAEAPIPPREVLERSVALPSETFPSDHLLLAADLTWL